jgi:hypothetical protein
MRGRSSSGQQHNVKVVLSLNRNRLGPWPGSKPVAFDGPRVCPSAAGVSPTLPSGDMPDGPASVPPGG